MIATIDFETTGLKAGEDEVLQVSIIDENYNVLLNVYCRPNNKGSWEDAQAVHGITPLMVANAQYWGVPQRRKRIYLIGDFGGQRAGEILFKSESVLGYTPKSKEQRAEAAGQSTNSLRTESSRGGGRS